MALARNKPDGFEGADQRRSLLECRGCRVEPLERAHRVEQEAVSHWCRSAASDKGREQGGDGERVQVE